MRNNLAWIGLAIVILGITALIIANLFGRIEGVQGQTAFSLIWAVALLLVIGGGAFARYRGQGGKALIHITIWLAIAAVVALLYSYRDVLGFR